MTQMTIMIDEEWDIEGGNDCNDDVADNDDDDKDDYDDVAPRCGHKAVD